MKSAVILHGTPSKEGFYNPEKEAESNSHWLPWIQKQLLIRDILAQAPELPLPYEPVYENWCREFERFDIGHDTILIGHSMGAGFLVRWLSENNSISVGKVALVAPYLGGTREGFDEIFFDFSIDEKLAARTQGLNVITAKDDSHHILKATDTLEDSIKGVHVSRLNKGGHLTLNGMDTREFPELLEVVT